jgi:hypothetical protein
VTRRRAPSTRTTPVAALLVVLVASSIVGCASSDQDLQRELSAERNQAVNVVAPEEVGAQPAGSPERAVMELWRAVQFSDAGRALDLIAPPRNEPVSRLAERYLIGTAALTASAKPDRVRAAIRGSRATALIRVRQRQLQGDRVTSPSIGTFRLELVRMRGDWRVRFTPEVTGLLGALL